MKATFKIGDCGYVGLFVQLYGLPTECNPEDFALHVKELLRVDGFDDADVSVDECSGFEN